jgi:hypothetical protein
MNDPVTEETPESKHKLKWPDAADFLNDETQAEAVAIAAAEILSVQEGMIKALLRSEKSIFPIGVKMAFAKKVRNCVSQLYLGVPNQHVQMVEMLVMTELFGGPEAVAKLQAEVDGGVVSTASTPDSKSVSEGSNPSMPSYKEFQNE